MKIRLALVAMMLCACVGSRSTALASGLEADQVVAAPADRRGEEQTFLTFPEWFLVFSPAEYAEFVKTHNPDEFCFWGHIGQLWSSYGQVIHQTRARHEPTNWGYHVMIMVIGVSTTVEYAIRSAYEELVGRVSGALAGGRTAEDDYAAQVAQEYVDFIRVRPWYEFDFTTRLKHLWTQTSFSGPHFLRKAERRYALTTEYLVKAVYGKIIEKATHTAYEKPILTTSVVVSPWPACEQAPREVALISPAKETEAQVALPRYQDFMAPATALAKCGANFQEIAGNHGVILMSALGPLGQAPPADTEVMIRQPIITQPGKEREVLVIPVTKLAAVLRGLSGQGLTVEHIFDY
jgi:hypothetical protein